MIPLNLSVCIMHEDGKWEYLFEFVQTWEEADLLAQYAMTMKTNPMDLIFVFPGNNRNIKYGSPLWPKACKLAQEYVSEKLKAGVL